MDITKEYIAKSYAKLNLFLKICDILPDNYHEVCTLLAKINLFDTITITFNKRRSKFSPASISMFSDTGESIESVEHNLILSAVMEILKLLEAQYGKQHYVIDLISRMRIKIQKRIPIGAGLGGGSSNAATVIRFLYENLEHLTIKDIVLISYKIGVDVAFFTRNYRCALGRHKGEKLIKLTPYYRYYAVIVCPNFSCNTSDVYQHFVLKKADKTYDKKILEMRNTPEIRKDFVFAIGNDLEKTAVLLYPEISDILKTLASTSAVYYSMTGTGSACFGLFVTERVALLEAKKLRKTRNNWSVYVSKVNF
ncbi:4-diphosphocytidyl-2-C-methyl-D-erythritol kinase [Candidatus Fokinia solitaria]|uniref:4-diphosphocytidyl-2-C-methyl-D-erythritol kinase n=1 Tax=Candidatus Fokinia solitaria TaxID=1802984 RepID=A0A2U8BRL5_9RICK|nr:4-(cytidine 5'-diphospho)-2-C-methyl-D-erythritol kinase [Candidatus Fokinia solitaria]AWD32910.1 4-diphosphocytidyl-2-C-methyl-D-erythritol kinase [Candidatus Fokinia solitaria]